MHSTRKFYSAVWLTLAACQTPSNHIERIAREQHMHRLEVAGREFRHTIYANTAASRRDDEAQEPLWIFIEGDGSPVEIAVQRNEPSIVPSSDPTARNPLALKLAMRTAAPAIYITRPCYGEHHDDPGCAARYWTSERYSEPVVASLVAAIEGYAGKRPINLVGYSGGGVLAVLVANELSSVRSVVTIAANLDIDAWTQTASCRPEFRRGNRSANGGGCTAFVNSTNPIDIVRSHAWNEFALLGDKDTVVPAQTTTRYFERHPDVRRWHYETFDHECCWIDAWPAIVERVKSEQITSPLP